MDPKDILKTVSETIDFLEESFPPDELPEFYDELVKIRHELASQTLPSPDDLKSEMPTEE